MKLYVRILLAGGLIEYGLFALLCILGFSLSWVWYGLAGGWLLLSERTVRRYVLPLLFVTTRCNCCR